MMQAQTSNLFTVANKDIEKQSTDVENNFSEIIAYICFEQSYQTLLLTSFSLWLVRRVREPRKVPCYKLFENCKTQTLVSARNYVEDVQDQKYSNLKVPIRKGEHFSLLKQRLVKQDLCSSPVE